MADNGGPPAAAAGSPSSTTSTVTCSTVGTAPTMDRLQTMWDDTEHFKKHEKEWECGWCGSKFQKVNHKKAMCHGAKKTGHHVRICTAFIPEAWAKLYRDLFDRKVATKAARKRAEDEMALETQEAIDKAAAARVEAKNKKQRQSMSDDDDDVMVVESAHAKASSVADLGLGKGLQQLLPFASAADKPTKPSPLTESNEAALDVAIGKMIFGHNMSFNFGESPLFREVIRRAKVVSANYVPPKKNAVAESLLDEEYKERVKTNHDKLISNANMFGLGVLGDGATIKKRPLFNVLATAMYMPPTVLAVHDCSEHLSKGGKKDAEYIAKVFIPHMEKLDPMKNRFDLFCVDGASNVQKAGQVVEAVFPRVTVIHGGEHCMSLVFTDIVKKISEIKVRRLCFAICILCLWLTHHSQSH